jgi:hypothetical protein
VWVGFLLRAKVKSPYMAGQKSLKLLLFKGFLPIIGAIIEWVSNAQLHGWVVIRGTEKK